MGSTRRTVPDLANQATGVSCFLTILSQCETALNRQDYSIVRICVSDRGSFTSAVTDQATDIRSCHSKICIACSLGTFSGPH